MAYNQHSDTSRSPSAHRVVRTATLAPTIALPGTVPQASVLGMVRGAMTDQAASAHLPGVAKVVAGGRPLITISSIYSIAMAASATIVALAQSNSILAVHTLDVQLEFTPRVARSRWVEGFLPRLSRALNGAKPTVTLLDRNGRTLIPETEIWFEDAFQVDIQQVTADASGNLYASGQMWLASKDGMGLICKVPQTGDPMLVIRTDEFLPRSVAVTKSGDIWAFGIPMLLQASRKTSEEYMTLWHWNKEGKLIDKILPRSTFGSDIIPTHRFGDIGGPILSATSTRLGVYSATSSRWIELDLKGKVLLDIQVPRPLASDGAKSALAELVMTESNAVFAYFTYQNPDISHKAGLYKLNKSSSKWTSVLEDSPSDEYAGLFGSDGDNLIFRAGTKTFGWVRAEMVEGRSAPH